MLPIRYFTVLLMLLVTCTNTGTKTGEIKRDTEQVDSFVATTVKPKKSVKPLFSRVDQVISDKSGIVWGNYTDHPTSILHFDKKGFIQIEYYGQCWYTYPITITNVDQAGLHIVVVWDDDMDCKFDMGFDKLRANIPKPTKRSLFALFNLQNDTLFAHYLYPKWVREMNKLDTSLLLFPESFAASVLD